MEHKLICVRQDNGLWDYECSCGAVRRKGLIYTTSATKIHAAHVKHAARAASLQSK